MSDLVLSLFPGIGLLDHAFEERGFCIVRGPDLLWGGDIRSFHPPAVFDGVIGGPPCQSFSPIGNLNKARWGEDAVMPDLIPEFRRILDEVRPNWWVMENSPFAYSPRDGAYELIMDLAWMGKKQNRRRCFWSNLNLQAHMEAMPALVDIDAGTERTISSKDSVDWKGSRSRSKRRTLGDMLVLQGFPPDFLDHVPLTVSAAKKAVSNGVPLAMGTAIADAVNRAKEDPYHPGWRGDNWD
jgi:DNA (cytosine-5)-methyltransferase 1